MPLLPVAFLAFVGLGLPDSILGVAWPALRAAHGLPLDALGLLLAATMAGYVASSFSCGKALARMGLGTLLALSTWATALSLAGFALAPWPGLLALAALAGLGAGAVDAGVNTWVTARFGARILGLLHASYAAGALLGPLLMSALLAAGKSWRWGYFAAAASQAALGAAFLATRSVWGTSPPGAVAVGFVARPVPFLATLRLPRARLVIALFCLEVGLEATAGQWAFSWLTGSRGFGAARAGLWVGAYWGGFLGGRLAMGFWAREGAEARLLAACAAGACAAALGLAGSHNAYVTVLSLLLLGAALAPVFPALTATTPARLGPDHAANAVGFQVAAATVGAALVPGLVGVAARRYGLEAVPVSLLAGALALAAGMAPLARSGPRRR